MRRAVFVTLILVLFCWAAVQNVERLRAEGRAQAAVARLQAAEAQAAEAVALTGRCLETSEGLAAQLRRAEDDVDRLRARR